VARYTRTFRVKTERLSDLVDDLFELSHIQSRRFAWIWNKPPVALPVRVGLVDVLDRSATSCVTGMPLRAPWLHSRSRSSVCIGMPLPPTATSAVWTA
jgi:hypothetical protein